MRPDRGTTAATAMDSAAVASWATAVALKEEVLTVDALAAVMSVEQPVAVAACLAMVLPVEVLEA